MDSKELIAKAKEVNSAEELLTLAKEQSIELTEEQAREYYDRLHATGELADNELDGVAGGGCGGSDDTWDTLERMAHDMLVPPRPS